MRACQTCCCLFSLQSGTQSIGLFCFVLSTINLSSALYQILSKVHNDSFGLRSILYGYGVLYSAFVALSVGLIYGAQAGRRGFLSLWILCALSIAGLEIAHSILLYESYDGSQTVTIAACAIHAIVILYFAFVVINAVVEITRTGVGNKVAPPRKESVTSEMLDDGVGTDGGGAMTAETRI